MSGVQTWEYTWVRTLLSELGTTMQDHLTELGACGWECIGIAGSAQQHAFSTLTESFITLILKRPMQPLPPPENPNPGWYDDPAGRHEKRYWDGTYWTASSGNLSTKEEFITAPTPLQGPVEGS